MRGYRQDFWAQLLLSSSLGTEIVYVENELYLYFCDRDKQSPPKKEETLWGAEVSSCSKWEQRPTAELCRDEEPKQEDISIQFLP